MPNSISLSLQSIIDVNKWTNGHLDGHTEGYFKGNSHLCITVKHALRTCRYYTDKPRSSVDIIPVELCHMHEPHPGITEYNSGEPVQGT
jgi:hypothetical protein